MYAVRINIISYLKHYAMIVFLVRNIFNRMNQKIPLGIKGGEHKESSPSIPKESIVTHTYMYTDIIDFFRVLLPPLVR